MSPYTFDDDVQAVDVTEDVCEVCDALITLGTVYVVDDYYRDGSSAQLCEVCAYHGALHE